MAIFYNLRIQFKGTFYQGWQIQPNVATIQGHLNDSLEKIFKSNQIHSTGSGRTDAGVHALDYLVKVQVPFFIEYSSLVKALNSHLPHDIRVLSAEQSNADFLPTNHAKFKEYHYRFTNNSDLNAFQSEFMANCSYKLDEKLMKEACRLFVGEHNFSDFQCTGSDVKTTIRKIYKCELNFVGDSQLGGIYPPHFCFQVVGNGFLKQMVRLMVGTLWNVGRKKVTIKKLEEALRNPCGSKLGIVAPANGLMKIKVTY